MKISVIAVAGLLSFPIAGILKALLIKVRPDFVAHLEHAKHLQSSLSKGN